MVEHPAARALTGFLLVRGGVHQVAYARALERLTGADLMKLFPAPRIPTDKIPECSPTSSAAITSGSTDSHRTTTRAQRGVQRAHPETGEDLVVIDEAPAGFPPTTFPPSPRCSLPTTRPRRSPRSPRSSACKAGLPKKPIRRGRKRLATLEASRLHSEIDDPHAEDRDPKASAR